MKTWSGANSDLLAQGGIGSDNTSRSRSAPSTRRTPSGLPADRSGWGCRYGTLPFLLEPAVQPSEFGVSAGTGIRFAQERAGVDLGLEHVWRSAGAFSERVVPADLGVTVRP